MMVRERSRWFERRQTRWGVEPHRVAEARGETPVAGQLSDAREYRLTAAEQQHGRYAAYMAFTRKAPAVHIDELQELASAVILVPGSFCGSRNSRNRKHLSMPS